MTKKRCVPCGGSGQVRGGGMIMINCEHCEGSGKIIIEDDDLDYLVTKQQESYQKAKKNIKAIDENITDEQAERILDDELNKSKTKRK